MGMIGGMIGRVLGRAAEGAVLGQTVRGIAGGIVPGVGRSLARDQFGEEFALAPQGWFDRVVNGVNRLPRPLLALGTLGLFGYAMAAPEDFGARMQGLGHMPEPLWWLLGAVVAFYFGTNEVRFRRLQTATEEGADNPALRQWQAGDR